VNNGIEIFNAEKTKNTKSFVYEKDELPARRKFVFLGLENKNREKYDK
jgi:hypothetical protein